MTRIFGHFSNNPKFNRIYLRDNLHKVKDRVYVINRDGKQSKTTH